MSKRRKKNTSDNGLKKPIPAAYKVALVAILAYALIYSIVFVEGPSFFGDDTVYLSLAHIVTQGNFHESSFIFSIRLLQIYPIALFYYLFGVSMLSSAAWDILSYILTIAVVFLIGRELYDNYAGIVASLLFAFFPLVVQLSATVSDDIPMAFVTSLAMLALLYATRRHSKKWYFLTGALVVASELVTPEGGIIAFPVIAYLLIQTARKKIKIDRTTVHFIYGVFAAGILLMLFNLFSSGNPLITLTLTSHFYSAVGAQNTIPSTNTDPMFYIQNMFPYNMLSIISSSISSGNLNPINIFNSIYLINYNAVGFYFYIMLISAAYLVLRNEKRSYFVLLWFIIAFGYLEFGPMHVSLSPFSYLLSYRLGRFLTIIAAPAVLLIGIAVSRLSKIRKRKIGTVLGLLAIIFLVLTALPINSMWYQITYNERFDQLAIASYLNALPNSTAIYFSSAFSMLPIYMDFSNMSRFYAYDAIQNCRDIPGNSYTVISKYIILFDLNYTPNPSTECPSWKLVLYPQTNQSFPKYITSVAVPFGAKLYYVPPFPANSAYNYFNLTGVGHASNNTISNFTVVNRVDSANVSISTNASAPGQQVNITVTYYGEFKWSSGLPTMAYLQSPIINVHYFGIELANQTANLSTQNGPGFDNFFSNVGDPQQVLWSNPNTDLRISWPATISAAAAGKTLRVCGGYFATYKNNQAGWASVFYNTTSKMVSTDNSSEINIFSKDCAYLKVT